MVIEYEMFGATVVKLRKWGSVGSREQSNFSQSGPTLARCPSPRSGGPGFISLGHERKGKKGGNKYNNRHAFPLVSIRKSFISATI